MANDNSQLLDVASTDGRNARALRTANAIAAAYLDLLQHGELRPTVRDIAASAGVSQRAVFRHFEDIESLFNVVAKMQMTRVMADVPELVGADEPLETRIDSFLERWCGISEIGTPVRRAANLNEPFSSEIKRRRTWSRKRRAADFETLFARELSAMSADDRRDATDAAASLLTWATWESLRTHRGLSITRATRVMTRTLQAIVGKNF